MKVYIIKKYGGEWDSYHEYIIKAFFSKEEAENYVKELEQEKNEKKQEYNVCHECPMYDWYKEFNTFTELTDCLKEYCGKFEYISNDVDFTKENQKFINSKDWDCIDCVNSVKWYDIDWYKIEEIEVE